MPTPEAPQKTTGLKSPTPNADIVKREANVQINIQFRPVELFIDQQDFYKTNGGPVKLKDYPKYIEKEWILYKINIRKCSPKPTFRVIPDKTFIGEKGYAKVTYHWIEENAEIKKTVKDFISQYFKITQTI